MKASGQIIMRSANLLSISILLFYTSCSKDQDMRDASGTFEARETIISSEAAGTILGFDVEEGQELKAGQTVGYVDSTQLHLRRIQLLAQIDAVLSRRPDVKVQLASLEEQLRSAERDHIRIKRLVEHDAAPGKQLEDVEAHIAVLKKQIAAQRASLNISTESANSETVPLKIQVDQLNDQLSKCLLVNPLNGTVLVKYAEVNEVTAPGKPLYKIADMSDMIMHAYISGQQLSEVAVNGKVKVYVDAAEGSKEYDGIITWISDKAEFTPKTIQTKDERANMVYAIKLKVKNDGMLKIGMYGEVVF